MPAQSKSEEVGDIGKTAVESLSLSGVTVVKRKTPSVPEGTTPILPQVVISVGEEGPTEYLTARKKLKKYPVAATIVTKGGTKAEDDPTVRAWREQIEAKLEARATWATLGGFNEVNITNKAPFDVSALAKDYNYATVVAEVQVIEARS